MSRVHEGAVFGRLTVLAYSHTNRERYWLCQCECGGTTTVRGSKLGETKSCGCLMIEKLVVRNFKHGDAVRGQFAAEYIAWRNMMDRCYKPTHRSYKDYGGRGITVCDRWHTYENFLEDTGRRPDGMTLDRMDNERPYQPGNVQWATPAEQANNRRIATKDRRKRKDAGVPRPHRRHE